MKPLFLTLCLIVKALVKAQILDSSAEMFCLSQDPSDCYPVRFEPTNEWQIVKEGQQIPPGLHVRVNLETGLEEARLLQEESNTAANIVVAEGKESPDMDLDGEEAKKKMQETIEEYKESRGTFSKNKLSVSDVTIFDNAVVEVLEFRSGRNSDRFEEALSTLSDLSHDIEFGARLTKNPAIFLNLIIQAQELVKSTEKESTTFNLKFAELMYRIMGSSLRNNPEAVKNVLDKQAPSFVDDLFLTLKDPAAPEVIHKRVLGVLHALSADRLFSLRYFNSEVQAGATGLHNLISVFPKLGSSAQVRVANIFEDLNIFPHSSKRVEIDESNVGDTMSEYLQDFLCKKKAASEEQMHVFFKSLLDIHLEHDAPVSNQFLQWLGKESEERNAKVRKSGSDNTLDELILRARHGVFSNPHIRKDEL